MERIVVASHVTPCGRSWADNLLLLLNVKWSYTDSFDDWHHIWAYDAADGSYRHRHREQPQRFVKRYCGAIAAQEVFRFRPGMEAISTHAYPGPAWRHCKKIYVVRDFRHALMSAFGRPMPGRSFSAFLAELDPDLMVPIYYGLQYHAESWLRQSPLHLVRQEDYRRDPEHEVARLAAFLGIALDAGALRAIAQASVSYVPQPTEIEEDWRDAIALMEERCESTLRKLGYLHPRVPGRAPDAAPPPRDFLRLAAGSGLYPGMDLWDGDGAAAPADPATAALALQTYLAPLSAALVNFRLCGGQRMVYGQPVGPEWKRGSKADAGRFVHNAAALFQAIGAAVLAGWSDAAPARGDGGNLLPDAAGFAGPAWAFDALVATPAGVAGPLAQAHQPTRLRTSDLACRPSLVRNVLLREQNAPHTFSVYAKAASLKDVVFQFSSGRTWCSAWFDSAAALAYRRAGNRGAAIERSAVTALQDGWVRLEACFAFAVEVERVDCRIYLAQDTGALDFAAGQAGELFLFGAQLEHGSVAGAYTDNGAYNSADGSADGSAAPRHEGRA